MQFSSFDSWKVPSVVNTRAKMKVSHSLRIALLAAFILGRTQSQGTSHQQRFTKRDGFRNTGGIIASFLAESVISCSTACVSECECNSFNLGPIVIGTNNLKLCDLVKTDRNSLANITEVPGWSLYLREYHVIDTLSIYIFLKTHFIFIRWSRVFSNLFSFTTEVFATHF